VGGWNPNTGLGQGPFGFGKAVKFVEEQCMYDTTWMKPDVDNELDDDPCMMNPLNCTNGLSWSVWEQMQYGSDLLDTKGGNPKKYIMSTGGDYNGRSGKAWPGFALYHQGLDIVAVVSTGEKVWELRVSGQLYNNTWTEVGIRWKIPDISKPKNAETEKGRERMGGLEMYINLEKVGHSILPESTDRGSTTWKPQPVLTHDGSEDGLPVMMVGCHQNSALKEKGNQFTGYAGTAEAPALFDEIAIWRRRLEAHELSYFLGGYSADFEELNADQFSAMLGNVDLADAEQAAAAQAVLQAMLMGPPTTLPPFPTRTRRPTTPMDPNDPNYVTESMGTTTSTTTLPPPDEPMMRKTMLGRQDIMSSMLKTDAVSEGQDPLEVEGRFAVSKVASAILSGTEDNQLHWDAVHQEPEHIGPMKTAKAIEEYMLAWVGSVNTTAFDPDKAKDDMDKNIDKKGENWKTNYFDSGEDSMRYATHSDDFVLNVDKLPFDAVREDGAVRMQYPDYSGWEWDEAKAKWENVKDNFTVPTGMFINIPGCREKPLTILTAVYNGLPKLAAKRRNPVSIRSKNFFIDSKVISVRAKVSSDPIVGDITDTYQCEPEEEYMKWNPIRMILYHSKPAKAKRTLLWHTDDYWKGLEVRHCVWWNERFGTNGAWDTSGCVITATDDEKSHCECSQFGAYGVLSEMLDAPNPDDKAIWIIALKWIGIIIGTLLLTIFIAVVFLSVVVGEMFHQLRMYCCLSYLIANLLMLVGDTSICEDRHSNMAISMALMFFFQAAMWWNMCEAHATFKGITCGLINGRTSVYHPIAWGMPLICVGFLCFMYGELLGTDPNCFISWENIAIEKFFYYNTVCFLLTFGFTVVIVFNVMTVQSHNKETVMYLSDQVKGLVLTSFLMFLLWSYCTLGWLSYYKNPERDFPNTMPLFQIFNGWFGVILFCTLGMWSKRFRIGLNSQAEEKKRMMQEKRDALAGKSGEKYEENADEAPLGSPVDGKSLAGTAPTSPVSSRPASAVADASRPATASSRPATAPKSRPATAGSTGASRPVSAAPPPDDEEQSVPDENPEEEASLDAIP